ncbi:Crp/Fnr family transcriptional regulator [Acidimangrovimonas sediminis]|uniref:Crp/Fnr family transcriptional regulator n=1 Tax=Acidimangrovimonas sediminis TaxID=2056283 RepID=UPI000C80C8CE|nr:Crp/Fnr family transcriptional regulator [Acidimangrovimonas sediminis]
MRHVQVTTAATQGRPLDKLTRLMHSLPAPLQAELESVWECRNVAQGEVLLAEGEDTGHVGYVVEGLLGMVKELPDGRRHIVGLLVAADMYGRAFDGLSGYRIEALADSVVRVCDREVFEDIVGRSPETEHMFLVEVLDELDAAREWVMVLGGPKIVQRLAAFLFILCRRKRREGWNPAAEGGRVNLRLEIRRQDLAHYLGARPESLSRAFHELERRGIIRINDPYDVDVLTLSGLVEAAGQDMALDADF